MHHASIIAAVSGAACLTLSCNAGTHANEAHSQPSAGAEQVTHKEAAPAPDLAYHMRASFWDAVLARDALIAGDLAKAQGYGDRLAKTAYDRMLPTDWRHWYGQLQQYAEALSIAPNLAEASQELGRIALVCGDCHDIHERGPDVPRTTPAPWVDPPESFDSRMHRHQLGMEQMWDGLVLPSEKAWRSGTITITRAPLRAPELADEAVDDATHQRVEQVRALAKAARAATTYEERGRVYGQLIAGCADCHSVTRPAVTSAL